MTRDEMLSYLPALDRVPAEEVRLFIQQLIVMGFDFEKNSAIQLLNAILEMDEITKGGASYDS